MTRTVTATYATVDAVRNAVDDLVGTGIARELIYADEEAHQVKVLIPETTVPEITELLGRHDPTRMVH